ncbi:Stabilin-2 [Desmophyllum pertusum]|uniref:Stabilin-2 n=1 Tax=Desmophyllum pertusum TaxID=174260 RepID=A0A9W9ZA66_9CNID|nr:Stabilin-2 [Desmophyllum pertusum]
MIFVLPSVLIAKRCDRQVDRYVWSNCMECSVNAFLLNPCPSGYSQVTSGEGEQRCFFPVNFGFNFGVVFIPGCQHNCTQKITVKQCCDGFWGTDCQACPGVPPCSGRGSCSDSVSGNGSCTCQDGFTGFACELCKDSNKFGSYCNETCLCKHGQCDSGLTGTGHCKPNSCLLGYTGPDCNITLPSCDRNLTCGVNADCFKVNNTDTCVCDPGYRNTSNVCTAINPCNDGTHGCHSNADCFYLGPGKNNCTCSASYKGDGTVCLAIDPCQSNNGGCPSNSTMCNYLQPGKSNCSCLFGFENYTSGAGCALINLCENGGGCNVNANCTMEGPGIRRCDCKDGYRGDGTTCYGNILQRVRELNLRGPDGLRGQLSTAIDLLSGSFMHRALAGAGPFTLFLMPNSAFANLTHHERSELLANIDMASHFVSRHLVAADLDSFSLKKHGKVTTLQGINASISQYQNAMYFKLDEQPVNASVLFRDLLAGNGMIHVIDKIMWHVGDYQETSSTSSLQVLLGQDRFTIFTSLLQVSGIASELSGLGASFTILLPVNSAFDKIDNSTMRFLTSTEEGKRKMKSLLRNHILTGKISVLDLLYSGKVISVEGESLTVKVTSTGQIILDEDSYVIESNVLTIDSILHVTDNLLIPDDIEPLLPRYCNGNTFSTGICYRCEAVQVMPRMGCPRGYSPGSTTSLCFYRLSYRGVPIGVFRGCRPSTCTAASPECCGGFYGASCHPCPGPFGNACNGNVNGQCIDKINGNGTCICQPNFKGTACELCEEYNKFGPFCNQTCTCMYGICDSGPQANGTCKPGSCSAGFHGVNCDQVNVPCPGSVSRRCHVHATCRRQGNVDICQCNVGYEDSGTQCSEIDPCSKPARGGCHHEAICTKTGPGTNNCSCDDGFHGDGVVCVAIDPCLEQDAGGCHSNAECRYIGPGQSICVCKPGYAGNGSTCYEVNPCLVNNGGCSLDAKCERTGPGNYSCQCNSGFIGDGYFCLGSVATIIGRINPSLEKFIGQGNMLHDLSDPRKNLTLFAPSTLALSQLSDVERRYWTNSVERLQYLIRYHLVDQVYTLEELKNITSLTTLNGLKLNITMQGQKVLIGGTAQIILPNISAENGFIHIIDKVLLPPHIPSENELPLTSEILKNIPEFSDFTSILQNMSLLSSLDACQACTVFAPTNTALLEKKNLTADTLKNHVVEHYLTEDTIRNGEEFTTWLKKGYLLKITKPGSGMLQVNGRDVIIKGRKARRAMVYGINGVLEPVKRNCDVIKSNSRYGGCTYCALFIPRCPVGWTKIGVLDDSCWITIFIFRVRGCQAKCQQNYVVKKCCDGFWGQDCQSCPGNLTKPCSSHGNCDDGKVGTGHCRCNATFTGTSCEKCIPGKYGRNCTNACKCVNGLCNEGIDADGRCFCQHGWKGQICNISANYANCLPTNCSRHATCRGPSGSGICECDAGYTGNGTHCTEINNCVVNNGGCDKNATCSVDINQPGFRSCQCNGGFTGDGFVCYEIDPCQRNNGGCHSNATCATIEPGKRNCFCKKDFSGDGVNSCLGVNPCELDNGGCSDRADCKQVGPHQRTCTCRLYYVGDGFTCIGDIMEALKLDPQLSGVESLIRKHGLDKLLVSHGYFNLLAPVNAALNNLQSGSRKRRSVQIPANQEEMLLKYHIIGCARIPDNTFHAVSANFTTLLGPLVSVKIQGNMTYFYDKYGNASKVIGVYESANGVIMKLDSVLSPPISAARRPKGSYIDVANNLGYKEFVKLVKRAGLRNLLDVPVNRPVLMFWPTDVAIRSLPRALMLQLINPARVVDLIRFIQYHVVTQIQSDLSAQSFLRSGAGLELRTFGGSSLFVSCKGGKGDLYVNGDSKLVERDVVFDGGVAFGVDKVLIPLGFGGNCDNIKETQITGQCGNCFVPASCPQENTLVGSTNHNCMYNGDLLGCQPICLQRQRVRRCCKNFYGPDCVVCPGGIQLPCSRRGLCIDGVNGNGKCACNSPFNGTACEQCMNNSSDSCPAPTVDCKADNGGCHVFAICSQTASDRLTCSCKPGYHGDGYYCQMIDLCASNNGGCGVNTTCLFTAPGTRRCLCKAGFYKVGSTCRPRHPLSPCSQNHGGCSIHANCYYDGFEVTCGCRSGFAGDGFTCEGTIIQVLKETRNATEFYKALYQLTTLSSEATSLFQDLESQSKTFTVFVPVNSAVHIKKFTLHVMKNHILSGRFPLNNMNSDLSLTTLAGTKLHIKKLTNGQVVVNGVAHVIGDLPATNGLVHVIDQMIPTVGPPPPSTVTPTKPTEPTEPSTENHRNTNLEADKPTNYSYISRAFCAGN